MAELPSNTPSIPPLHTLQTTPERTRTGQDGLLGLPPEIRDQIYELTAAKDRNTITMLSNHDCHKSEISASQPALSRVNHQLRAEALPTFYNTNLFLAEVSNREDLATAKRWLQAIGDLNVGCLRRVALCGWAKVPFGHMVTQRWVKVFLDLKEGTMEVEPHREGAEQHPHVAKAVDELKTDFREVVEARQGLECAYFDVESVASLMDAFHWMCMVC
ncbi:hypothetical protein LTR08_008337 [Meristemomyces frigidus]|nr:hypothetical protein LTR08_008337 [Meristemomyces frigidus]